MSHRPEPKHQQKEKETFAFFTEVIEGEINVTLLQNEKNEDLIPLRTQLILSFVLSEVLASYWYEFKGITGTPTERFIEWYKEFCKTTQNKIYKQHSHWATMPPDRLFELRNSLIHFMGLSAPKDYIYFSLVSNDLPDSDFAQYEQGLSKNGNTTFVIKPKEFNLLIKEGGVLMLNRWARDIREANDGNIEKRDQYICGIDRIWRKIQSEGAVKIIKKK